MVKDQLHELSAAIAALTEQVPAVTNVNLRASLKAVISSAENELAVLQNTVKTVGGAGRDDMVRPPIVNVDAASQPTTELKQRKDAAALVTA
jgi:hypothetical protein